MSCVNRFKNELEVSSSAVVNSIPEPDSTTVEHLLPKLIALAAGAPPELLQRSSSILNGKPVKPVSIVQRRVDCVPLGRDAASSEVTRRALPSRQLTVCNS